MEIVFFGILAVAAAVVAIFLIPALLEIKRAARSAALTLDALRSEIRPAMNVVEGTLEEYRALAHRANEDLLALEELAEQARRVMDPAKRVLEMTRVIGKVSQLAVLARAGQRAIEVFLDRLAKSSRR